MVTYVESEDQETEDQGPIVLRDGGACGKQRILVAGQQNARNLSDFLPPISTIASHEIQREGRTVYWRGYRSD